MVGVKYLRGVEAGSAEIKDITAGTGRKQSLARHRLPGGLGRHKLLGLKKI
jgi:hypothetical protein